jgi:hypothetical protein
MQPAAVAVRAALRAFSRIADRFIFNNSDTNSMNLPIAAARKTPQDLLGS